MAQEKAQTFNGKKVNGQFQFDRDKTAYVNHHYFYIDDEDFGPLFIKVCSYAPWSKKLCLNGHAWAKRQLEKKKIAYEALDNGFLSCAEPDKLQQICDSLGPAWVLAMTWGRATTRINHDSVAVTGKAWVVAMT